MRPIKTLSRSLSILLLLVATAFSTPETVTAVAPQVEFHLTLSPVELLPGGVRSYFDGNLSPVPNRYQLVHYGAGLKFFLTGVFGIEADYDLPTHGVAVSPGVPAISLFQQESFRFGPVFRLPFLVNPDGNAYHALNLSGGLVYGVFTFDTAFRQAVTNLTVPSTSASGWGYFVQLEYGIRLGGNAQFSVGARLEGSQPTFPGSSTSLSHMELQFPIRFSLVFGDLWTKENRMPEIRGDRKR